MQSQPDREVQGFTERFLPEPDPFDRAVMGLNTATPSSNSYGLWPWLAALLGIGLIANARSHRVLNEALRKERRRIIRLRSLVPTDRLPNAKKTGIASTRPSDDENPELGQQQSNAQRRLCF
jgi:hypothetical protein